MNFNQPSLKLLAKHRDGAKITKTYDVARTPCQRLVAFGTLPNDLSATLRRRYMELDPVALLGEIEGLQDRLWAHVNGAPNERVLGTKAPVAIVPPKVHPSAGTPAIVQASADTSEPSRPHRLYRRTKKEPVPRTWLTRADPFAAVWPRIQLQLQIDPSQTAVELFQGLQTDHPDMLGTGPLRTLQRRVKTWRQEHLYLDETGPDAFGQEFAAARSVRELIAEVVR
ncbi:MAG TPA: hypothetical protein VGM37_15165 [Armatimonadota bacterium]